MSIHPVWLRRAREHIDCAREIRYDAEFWRTWCNWEQARRELRRGRYHLLIARWILAGRPRGRVRLWREIRRHPRLDLERRDDTVE